MTDIQIYEEVIDAHALEISVYDDTCGGIVSFVGTVRNVTKGKKVLRLEFEAYESMAIKEMQKIANQALERWPIKKLAIHHRTGIIPISDIAVVISVSSQHRSDAFEACRFCIDTLKETVPIWKKEIFEDGETWVSAHP
jgi:molybdopterin synthase catalytic subunit